MFDTLMGMTDSDINQRTILRALLDAHPRMLGLDDLGVAIPDPAAVEYAVTQLASDGLATNLGERVGATRPAVRFRALEPG
jgi:hypothetical protein